MANAARSEGDSRGRLWKSFRTLMFGDAAEQTLREQIEEKIAEADEDENASANASNGDNGDLSAIEREMLRNMLSFGDKTADDVAVPRGDIIALAETASFDDAVAAFEDADHSRLPVYRGSLDEVVGMLHVKDLFGIMARDDQRPASLSAILRQPLYVPQSMSAMELLAEMRAKRVHLAIVLDEYGGTDGLVTIEDLMEEIVGDIEDEHDDAPVVLIQLLDDGIWEADARVELEDLARDVHPVFAIHDEEVDTLGGLAAMTAERVPAVGEVVALDSGWRLEILAADERRIERLRIHAPSEAMIGEFAGGEI